MPKLLAFSSRSDTKCASTHYNFRLRHAEEFAQIKLNFEADSSSELTFSKRALAVSSIAALVVR